MNTEQFAYWLQGFAELNAKPPTQEQWDSIRAHLQTVFVKVTPQVKPPFPIVAPADTHGPGLLDLMRQWPQGDPVVTC